MTDFRSLVEAWIDPDLGGEVRSRLGMFVQYFVEAPEKHSDLADKLRKALQEAGMAAEVQELDRLVGKMKHDADVLSRFCKVINRKISR